jgi:hypothetical protein
LENDKLVIDDVVFLGCTLWTDFKLFGDPRIAGCQASLEMTDYKRIRVSPEFRRLRPTDTASIHWRSRNWLKEELAHSKNKKVVVTHHAPSMRSVAQCHREDIVSAAFASHMDNVVRESGARVWIHGHGHATFDYVIGNTRVVCNPRGYPDEPNSAFIPDLLVEV